MNAVRQVQKGIIQSIKDDFGRYIDQKGNVTVNGTLKLRAEACLSSVPAQWKGLPETREADVFPLIKMV